MHLRHRQLTCASDFVLSLRAAKPPQKREQKPEGKGLLLLICHLPCTTNHIICICQETGAVGDAARQLGALEICLHTSKLFLYM